MFGGISYYQWLRMTTLMYWYLPGEHLGLQSIAAYLEQHNSDCSVKILNGCLEEIKSLDDFLSLIDNEYPFDIAAISGPADVFPENRKIALHIKSLYSQVTTVLGNYFPTLCYKEILTNFDCFDYLSIGSGEECLSQLAKYIQNKISINDIPSIAYKKENHLIVSDHWTEPSMLTTLPPPVRSDINKLLKTGLSASIYASRGCAYACKYCASGSLNYRDGSMNHYVLRDPIEVVDEIEVLVTTFNVPRITIIDDTFGANTPASKEQAFSICREMKKRSLKVPFMIDTRIDCIDKELFSELKSVGLERIFMGIEARDTRTLKAYNKGYQLDDTFISEKLSILKDLEISVAYGVIPLYPGATLDELETNVDFIYSLKDTDPFMFLKEFVPYPGSVLTEYYQKQNLIVGDFPYYSVQYFNSKIKQIKKNYNILLDKYFLISTLLNVDYKFYMDPQYIPFINASRDFFYYFLKALIDISKKESDAEIYTQILNAHTDIFKKLIEDYGTPSIKNATFFISALIKETPFFAQSLT